MRIILGLGNPGAEYQNTRHNIGFWILDALGEKHRLALDKKGKNFSYAVGRICKQQVILVKPTTYMNESGLAAKAILQKFLGSNGNADEFMVVHDEIDLPLGRLKLKKGGGNAGHNGLESITREIGNGYYRCRVGVGRPSGFKDAKDHVLSTFNGEDEKAAHTMALSTCQTLEDFLVLDFTRVQNRWHGQDLLNLT